MRPSYIEISTDALRHNFRAIKKHTPNSLIMPVLKANAYGHGLLECAQVFEEEGADYFGVAFLEEAIQLREAGVSIPILTLGGMSNAQVDLYLKHNIDFLASSLTKLKAIEDKAKSLGTTARVHIKVDTGMERVGVHHYSPDLEKMISFISQSSKINLVGISTHFADSEAAHPSFMQEQIDRFDKSLESIKQYLPDNVVIHVANSGAILAQSETHRSLVRPGLILYGISPAPHLNSVLDLQPALQLKSEVVYFKVIEEGASVSYGCTWKASQRTRIITIPLGYGDGLSRALSNKGSILLNGNRYPIVGRICMDQFMVDIGPDGEAYLGDTVTIIGAENNEIISVSEIADLIHTDPREVLCMLNLRVPRLYV